MLIRGKTHAHRRHDLIPELRMVKLVEHPYGQHMFELGLGQAVPEMQLLRRHGLPRDSKVGRPATRGMAGLVGRRAGVAQP